MIQSGEEYYVMQKKHLQMNTWELLLDMMTPQDDQQVGKLLKELHQ